ncbi:hypothetical protein EON65_20270 [archaeon]|nr:MAG: hypothetical protein EON65_20270 [archaeon]
MEPIVSSKPLGPQREKMTPLADAPLSHFILTSLEDIHPVSVLLFSAMAYERTTGDIMSMGKCRDYGVKLN